MIKVYKLNLKIKAQVKAIICNSINFVDLGILNKLFCNYLDVIILFDNNYFAFTFNWDFCENALHYKFRYGFIKCI